MTSYVKLTAYEIEYGYIKCQTVVYIVKINRFHYILLSANAGVKPISFLIEGK